MKTLELFFNNEEKNFIYDSWCFESEPQEKNLGNLYILAKLNGNDSTSLDLLASSISNAYSGSGSLEDTISLTNKKIKERGLTNLEIAILAIKNNTLNFTKTDNTKIALIRSNEVINIGDKLKGNLTNIGTIDLKKKDKIITITGQAWRKLRQKHLISKISGYQKTKRIKKILSNDGFPGAAIIITLETSFFQKSSNFLFSLIDKLKNLFPDLSKPSFLQKRMITSWPERKAEETPYLITLSYLLSFATIRTLVHLVGSINSPIAQTVKESSSLTHFHIGRNIILFGYHIHHFYFGIILIAVAGWMSITNSDKISNRSLAIIYGIGLGLLMDEIGLLLTWGSYTSSLSYLLGVLLLGIILNIIYFPSFWKKVRGKIAQKKFGLTWLNEGWKLTVQIIDKITGRD